ncbi:MAG: hypothetical protein RL590_213, partial [Actinomycetota bacterium]
TGKVLPKPPALWQFYEPPTAGHFYALWKSFQGSAPLVARTLS